MMTLAHLPEIQKTDVQLLIEAKDPEGRDVREILKSLYDQHRRLESVADALTALTGRKITHSAVHEWATGWGWSFERVLVIPEAAHELTEAA